MMAMREEALLQLRRTTIESPIDGIVSKRPVPGSYATAGVPVMVVVADTAPGALMPYGQRPLGLLPYLGDSTIVVDPATLALVVLNTDGTIQRLQSASPQGT
jgi:hypothetical protein